MYFNHFFLQSRINVSLTKKNLRKCSFYLISLKTQKHFNDWQKKIIVAGNNLWQHDSFLKYCLFLIALYNNFVFRISKGKSTFLRYFFYCWPFCCFTKEMKIDKLKILKTIAEQLLSFVRDDRLQCHSIRLKVLC